MAKPSRRRRRYQSERPRFDQMTIKEQDDYLSLLRTILRVVGVEPVQRLDERQRVARRHRLR